MAVTTTQDFKAIAREDIERVWKESDFSFVDEHYADDYVLHDMNQSTEIYGPEGYKSYVQAFQMAFPDLDVIDYEIISEGETVAIKYTWRGTHEGELMGIEPTGREVEASGMAFSRFEDGKIREDWVLDDTLGLFQQLGIIESLGE